MAATKSGSSKGSQKSSGNAAKVHTETTATMLAFANPPAVSDKEQVAETCAKQGLIAIGITGPFTPDAILDFGAFKAQDCVDLADSIENCVAGKGFHLPPLAATFDVMRQEGTKITFANFVKALVKMMS